MLNNVFNVVDFSDHRSEEVISFFWRSAVFDYICIPANPET